MCLQVGAYPVGASDPVLAGMGGHAGRSHRDHCQGPAMQAHP